MVPLLAPIVHAVRHALSLQQLGHAERLVDILGVASARGDQDSRVDELIAQRKEARAARDFALADEIRQQLTDMNVVIEDTKDGTRWRFE